MRCFRFLRGNGDLISNDCLAFSFIGKNKDIIQECLIEIGDELKRIDIMDTVIQINDEDYLISLHDQYKQSWHCTTAASSLNLKAFLINLCMLNEADIAFSCCGFFGISEIIELLHPMSSSKIKSASAALIRASCNNCLHSIKKLIELGANIEEFSELGTTAMMAAAYFDCDDTILKLVELGAKLETKDNMGRTALFNAVECNFVDSISILIKLGAILNHMIMMESLF